MLVIGEGEGEGGKEGGEVDGGHLRPLHIGAPLAQEVESAGQHEQLVKGQAAVCLLQRLKIRGEVDMLVGVAAVAQAVG